MRSLSRFRLSDILWARSCCSFVTAVLLTLSCPRCRLGVQSELYLSHRLAALPEWKWMLQTRSFSRIFSVKSSRLMAANHLVRRSVDKTSVSSPWLFSAHDKKKDPSIYFCHLNNRRWDKTKALPKNLRLRKVSLHFCVSFHSSNMVARTFLWRHRHVTEHTVQGIQYYSTHNIRYRRLGVHCGPLNTCARCSKSHI